MATNKFMGVQKLAYTQAKTHIQTGDLLFCSGNYMVSKVIQKFSGSMFSHIGLVFHWNNRIMMLESVEDDGVRVVPVSHYLQNYENTNKPYNGTIYIARHKDIENAKQEELHEMIGTGLDLLNRNYDKDEIARIVSRIALGIGKHKDDQEYICSELIEECLKKIGITFQVSSGGFLYPEDIAKDDRVVPLFELVGRE